MISGRTEHSLVWQSGTQEDDSKSSKQDSEQPSKKKNVRDPPDVAKEKKFRVKDTHIILKTESRQSLKRNRTSNNFTFNSCNTEKVIINSTNKVFERKSLRSWVGELARFQRLRLEIRAIGY